MPSVIFMPIWSAVCAAVYPIMYAAPEFIMQTKPATYNGRPYNDYYFICRIYYTPPSANDNSVFEVVLVVDWWEYRYQVKKGNATNRDVIFSSTEVSWALSRTVGCTMSCRLLQSL